MIWAKTEQNKTTKQNKPFEYFLVTHLVSYLPFLLMVPSFPLSYLPWFLFAPYCVSFIFLSIPLSTAIFPICLPLFFLTLPILAQAINYSTTNFLCTNNICYLNIALLSCTMKCLEFMSLSYLWELVTDKYDKLPYCKKIWILTVFTYLEKVN